MEKVIIALAGVALGFLLNFVKDLWLLKVAKQKNIEYLAIQTGCLLDKFINGCFEVIWDNGLCQGQADKDGYRSAQVLVPTFEPEKADVDWKCLSSGLMYEILNFNIDIDNANAYISSAAEHSAFPPDFDEYFEARQYRYAQLGIKAFKLSAELRSLGKLPEKEFTEWNSIKVMEDKVKEIDVINKKRNDSQAKMHAEMNAKITKAETT
jgi:hypothetical protein